MVISILERTKDHIIVKISRRTLERFDLTQKDKLTEEEALKILRAGMLEYKKGGAKKLISLRELRYGN